MHIENCLNLHPASRPSIEQILIKFSFEVPPIPIDVHPAAVYDSTRRIASQNAIDKIHQVTHAYRRHETLSHPNPLGKSTVKNELEEEYFK